jgi:hypothetical protein
VHLPEPVLRVDELSCGSALLASRCQAIPTDAAAIPVPAAPASSPAVATRLALIPAMRSSSQNWPAGQVYLSGPGSWRDARILAAAETSLNESSSIG